MTFNLTLEKLGLSPEQFQEIQELIREDVEAEEPTVSRRVTLMCNDLFKNHGTSAAYITLLATRAIIEDDIEAVMERKLEEAAR